MAATRQDWKNSPLPDKRERLSIDIAFTGEAFTQLQEGFIPQEMEDKWFVFFDEPWLYFHRSWTGHCIYEVRCERTSQGVRLCEALVNRDWEQYRVTDADQDIEILTALLHRFAGPRS